MWYIPPSTLSFRSLFITMLRSWRLAGKVRLPMLPVVLALLLAGCASPTPSAAPTLTPTPAGPAFSEITFGTDVTDDGDVLNPLQTFAPGTGEVWAFFNHSGMKPGQRWGRVWKKDGETVEEHSTETWAEDYEDGWMAYSFLGDPALEGDYSLTLYLDGQPVREAHFSVPAPLTPTPDYNPPQLGDLQFTHQLTEEGLPAEVLAAFNPGLKTLYGTFTFTHMPDGIPWKCEWLFNGEFSTAADLTWDLGNTGNAYCSYYYDDDSALEPGDYQLNVYVDGKLAVSGQTKVLAQPASGGGAGVANEWVDADLLPVWALIKTAPQPAIQDLVDWAEQNHLEIRLGETGGELASYTCPVGGKGGKILVSRFYLRTRSWEENAGALVRELTRARRFAERGSCTCILADETEAVQAQADFVRDLGAPGRLEASWKDAISSDGLIVPPNLAEVLMSKYPQCR